MVYSCRTGIPSVACESGRSLRTRSHLRTATMADSCGQIQSYSRYSGTSRPGHRFSNLQKGVLSPNTIVDRSYHSSGTSTLGLKSWLARMCSMWGVALGPRLRSTAKRALSQCRGSRSKTIKCFTRASLLSKGIWPAEFRFTSAKVKRCLSYPTRLTWSQWMTYSNTS